MKFIVSWMGNKKEFSKKIRLIDLLGDSDPEKNFICAKVNNRVRELTYELYYDAEVEFLTVKDQDAIKIYEASVRYLTAMAFYRAYPNLKVRFAYNVSRCISVHLLTPGFRADNAMLLKLRHEMEAIVAADLPIERTIVPNEEAAAIFKEKGYLDKLAILPYRPEKTVHLNTCDGFVDYMYQRLVPSTGYIKRFKVRLYSPGFLIQYPRAEAGGKIPEFQDAPTFGRVLQESHDWGKIVGGDTVAGINSQIKNLGEVEFINVCEARHNRQLCELGQLIQDDIENIRLICIAGPSSSGKTTFANRLRVELLSRGIKPIRISLDDYYRPREETPIGPDGKHDFESIEALDIGLFNQNMLDLINGETVTLPHYDFATNKRVPGRTLSIREGEPLIVEGIHALNDRLTVDLPKSVKYKIFIAPSLQVNLDDHNPLSMTDLRLIRRIVRDKKFRNSPIEETLSMWPSVRRGEFAWIYDQQEGSDFVFNSVLPYELPVLKKYALPLLESIDGSSPYYPIALRLRGTLKYFVSLDDRWVPSNSLMREFIGGSCYAE